MTSRFFAIVVGLLLGACATSSKSSPGGAGPVLSKLAKISLGDTQTAVTSKIGFPSSKTTEVVGTVKYETWSYSNSDGSPLGFLSMDPDSGQVSGRSIWISDEQQEKDFIYLQNHIFPEAHFDEFNTCDQHWGSKIKIDRKLGILVGLRRSDVFMVADGDSRLLTSWVEQLGTKCPKTR